jgi:hypothetical protein
VRNEDHGKPLTAFVQRNQGSLSIAIIATERAADCYENSTTTS